MKRQIKVTQTLKKVPTIFFKEVIDNTEVECDPNTKSGERIKLTLILKNTDATDYQYEVIDQTQDPPKSFYFPTVRNLKWMVQSISMPFS